MNDSQVPNLASEQAARTMGIPLLTPTSKGVWGLDTVTGADAPGSAMVYFNFDRELGVEGNVPPDEDSDVHGDQRFLLAAQLQIDAFLRPDSWRVRGLKGRERAVATFSWEAKMQAAQRIYERLAAPAGSAPEPWKQVA